MNAKELILSKINATDDFADTWSHLMMNGWTVEEIGNYLTSAAFAVVSVYSKADVFSDIVKHSSAERSLEFVLGLSQLPGANIRVMKALMAGYRNSENGDNLCFMDKLLYETYTEDIEIDGKKHFRGEIILDFNGNPIPRKEKLITPEDVEKTLTTGSDHRKNILGLLGGRNLGNALRISQLLLDHTYYVFKNKAEDNSEAEFDEFEEYQQDDEWVDVENEPEYSEDFYGDYEDDGDEFYQKKMNSVDFDKDTKIKMTKKELRDVYRYLKAFVIPKNQRMYNLGLESYFELNRYQEHILPAVKEQKLIGSMLSINQGISTDEHGFYAKLKRVQNYVNSIISEEEIQQHGVFDIYTFLDDPGYRDTWISIMDIHTHRSNPLKVIWNVAHFREMYKLNSTASNFMNHAVVHRFNTRFEKALLGDSTQSLSEQEWKVMEKYTHELIQLNWLFSKGITFNMPATWLDGTPRISEVYEDGIYGESDLNQIDEPQSITLNDSKSAATFVRFFETYIVPTLKQHFNNAFTKNLTFGSKFSKTHNYVFNHVKLKLNTMTADSSSKTKAMYSEILRSFTDIAEEIIPGTNLTVQDAVFIYNTLVYKNGFTENGFTRLMETINLIHPDALINDYAEFIADLDSGDIDTEGTIDADGNINFGIIKGHINDLLYRLSFLDSANYKFGVTQEKDANNAVSKLIFVDLFGNESEDKNSISVNNPNPNDWCLEMPVWGSTGVAEKPIGYNNGIQKRYSFTSKEVVMAVTENLISRFGLQDKIEYISEESIKEAWANKDNPEYGGVSIKNVREYLRIRNAKAFLNGGKIYVNLDKVTNDTVLHEIMHLVCAGAKFNDNEEIRKTYYNLISIANDYAKANPKFYKNMREAYSEERGSDFKEEVLIALLTDAFTTKFRTGFNGIQYSTNIGEYVNGILNEIFEAKIPVDADPAKVGNTKLGDLLITFNGKLIDVDNNPLGKVDFNLSQKLKTLKRILIQAGFDEKNSWIKYNC